MCGGVGVGGGACGLLWAQVKFWRRKQDGLGLPGSHPVDPDDKSGAKLRSNSNSFLQRSSALRGASANMTSMTETLPAHKNLSFERSFERIAR